MVRLSSIGSRRRNANLPAARVAPPHADEVSSINILSRGMEVLRDEGRDTAQACAGWETTARIACEVNGAVRPSAAGTLRGSASMRSPVGISGLQAGKDGGKTQHRSVINLAAAICWRTR